MMSRSHHLPFSSDFSSKESAAPASNDSGMSVSSLLSPAEPESTLSARLLGESDRPALNELMRTDPVRFMTIRINVEHYGFRSQTLRVIGVVEKETGTIYGVGLRFANTLIVADTDGRSGAAFAEFVDIERGLVGVRGTEPTLQNLGQNLRRLAVGEREKSLYMLLRRPPSCPPEVLYMARAATLADLDKLAELYAQAGHMFRARPNLENKLRQGRIFVVEEPATFARPARFAACALLNVEGSDAGVIGGVFTLPETRGKGYATACTAALCKDLQRDGKIPCLFYENPIAGHVYRHLGFEQVDEWGVLYLVNRRQQRKHS